MVALKAFAGCRGDGESIQREWNDYHVPGYSCFHSVINLWWFAGCVIWACLCVCVCGDWGPGCRSNGAKGMITLKRSDLSPVPAINTAEKERQTHWVSNADTDRGRWRGKEGERLRRRVVTKMGADQRERGQIYSFPTCPNYCYFILPAFFSSSFFNFKLYLGGIARHHTFWSCLVSLHNCKE